MYDIHQFHKVSARWVPENLTEIREKKQKMSLPRRKKSRTQLSTGRIIQAILEYQTDGRRYIDGKTLQSNDEMSQAVTSGCAHNQSGENMKTGNI